MNLELLQNLIKNPDIEVFKIIPNRKASEIYIEVSFHDIENEFIWTGLVPYVSRWTGLDIKNEEELVIYLESIAHHFKKEIIENWIIQEKLIWETNRSGQKVTKGFFDEMSSMKWTNNFPPNNNPSRRIQDIKQLGYTIASINKGSKRLLIPIPVGLPISYEKAFSKKFVIKALKALNNRNVYEMSSGNKVGLLLDHKFPENRWDAETKTENPETMSEKEIQDKFQLLDNQRNLQKREVCRNCFQSGKRGVIFGIKYYYEGNENWNKDIPKIGKDAEKGCVGCGWYDIATWRKSLNKTINQAE